MTCCTTHSTPANLNCAGCSKALCFYCTVKLRDRDYCPSCKASAVAIPPVATRQGPRAKPNLLSGEALRAAIIGYVCCPLMLGPTAIIKGYAAAAQDPEEARAAVTLGWLQLFFCAMTALFLGRRLLVP